VEASSEAFKSLKNSAQDRVGERRIIGSMVRRRVYQRGFEMSISAAQVKELRELTGAGMMDCKAALAETNGDMEAAVDWLRKKGIAKADKKAGRTAAEGLIGVDSGLREAAIVEVNSETDFVARNEAFQEIVRNVAKVALAHDGDHAKSSAAKYPHSDKSVADTVKDAAGTIGENLSFRRSAKLSVSTGAVATYVHNSVADNLGKLGVLVAIETTGDAAKAGAFARQVAMHVAATSPLALSEAEVDPAAVEREKSIFADQARQSGKPENIIEKMVEGRLRKFYEEVVLVKQAFVMNPDLTVEKALKEAEKEIGAPAKITGFIRFALGEGIEKEASDFAAEVAAAVKK
jgi:elongation factor Ts